MADALRDSLEPIEKPEKALMLADAGLAHPLASQGPNCYPRFFQRYAASHFLTFNYDSLAEIILFVLGRWYPHDGYGLPVTTDLGWEDVPAEVKTGSSSSLVLHLHGSFCLYTSNHKPQQGLIVERERPLFYFAPNFPIRYSGALRGEQQIVAPIPDKAPKLVQSFVRRVYNRAAKLAAGSDTLIAIGYSFSPHDGVSYGPILRTFARASNRKLISCRRMARAIAGRLRREYPHLTIDYEPIKFRKWVASAV